MNMNEPYIKPGEKFVGTIITHDGEYHHHLILLPGYAELNNWQAQLDWAASIGGDLPDRVEGALINATMHEEFKPEWHWLKDQYATYSDLAWLQDFDDGDQTYDLKGNSYRACAVRRVKIKES